MTFCAIVLWKTDLGLGGSILSSEDQEGVRASAKQSESVPTTDSHKGGWPKTSQHWQEDEGRSCRHLVSYFLFGGSQSAFSSASPQSFLHPESRHLHLLPVCSVSIPFHECFLPFLVHFSGSSGSPEQGLVQRKRRGKETEEEEL